MKRVPDFYPVILYLPKTEEGKRELKKRVADAHADFVIWKIRSLDCSIAQKIALTDAVIETYKEIHSEIDKEECSGYSVDCVN